MGQIFCMGLSWEYVELKKLSTEFSPSLYKYNITLLYVFTFWKWIFFSNFRKSIKIYCLSYSNWTEFRFVKYRSFSGAGVLLWEVFEGLLQYPVYTPWNWRWWVTSTDPYEVSLWWRVLNSSVRAFQGSFSEKWVLDWLTIFYITSWGYWKAGIRLIYYISSWWYLGRYHSCFSSLISHCVIGRWWDLGLILIISKYLSYILRIQIFVKLQSLHGPNETAWDYSCGHRIAVFLWVGLFELWSAYNYFSIHSLIERIFCLTSQCVFFLQVWTGHGSTTRDGVFIISKSLSWSFNHPKTAKQSPGSRHYIWNVSVQ